VKLPVIHLDKIKSLKQAINVIAQLLQVQQALVEKLTQVEAENAALKGQPRKPSFGNKQKGGMSQSVTKLLKEKGTWKKSSKKGKIPIDREVKLEEVAACVCGNSEFTTVKSTAKIVQGIVFLRDNVVYRGRVKACTRCGKRYRSIIPDFVRGISFSPAFASFASFWHYGCRVTIPLLLRTVRSLGMQISSGQVSRLLMHNGNTLQAADRELRTEGIKRSSHLQSDATGSKRKDKKTGRIINQYVQIISNKLLSIFSITRHYNSATLNRLLTREGRKKPFVSDDGSPNGECLKCKGKQLCWVHEIRHYQKLFPFFNPYQPLQQKILGQWQKFYHLAKHYAEAPPEQGQKKKKQIQKLFEKITTQTTGYDLVDKQLRLTRAKKERLLFFLDHPGIPIHNNQCEQDLREFVIQRKISGGTKSVIGDKSLARHLSVIQTAQKQGLDVYQTIHGLLTETLSPAVLTANIH